MSKVSFFVLFLLKVRKKSDFHIPTQMNQIIIPEVDILKYIYSEGSS